MSEPTIPSAIALALHTDLATINLYAMKSPAITLAVIQEAEDKLAVITAHLAELRRNYGQPRALDAAA